MNINKKSLLIFLSVLTLTTQNLLLAADTKQEKKSVSLTSKMLFFATYTALTGAAIATVVAAVYLLSDEITKKEMEKTAYKARAFAEQGIANVHYQLYPLKRAIEKPSNPTVREHGFWFKKDLQHNLTRLYNYLH
jgi:hypothetical protein